MSLRSKLLLAQLPLLFALLIVGLLSRHTIGELGANAQNILKDNHASVLAAQRMRESALALAGKALTSVRGHAALSPESLAADRAMFDQALHFQDGNVTEVGERELTDRVRASWRRYDERLAQLSAAPPEQANRLYLDEVAPELQALLRGTEEIASINQDAMVRKSVLARKESARWSALTVVTTLGALLLGLLASAVLTSRLVRPLSVLSQAVRRVGEGDLVARARIVGRDEIAQVAREFNVMADRLGEYRSSSLGELLQAQRASQAAIDSLPDPVLVLATDGRLLNVNITAETLLGLSVESELPDPIAAADPTVREQVHRLSEHVRAGKGAYVPKGLEESVGVLTSEGVRYFLSRAMPVFGERGELVGLTVLLQDVTRLRRFDELKNDLVATVAHEFRTPLTSLRMAIHLCLEGTVGPISEKQADLLFAAREDCERLQGIVDDLLDLSRIQAGRIELHSRPVSSASLLESAIDAHRAIAKERKVELSLGAPTIDKAVLADTDRLQLVLGNLVSNALRHTREGGRVDLRAAPDGKQVRFEVRDTGEGIAREHLDRLFERFYRVPGAQSGGAGLGLYIAKEIVDAHGGHIGVESDPGQGSVFWFTLPAAPQPSS
jgi:NtrC-family two-component system sensor histidine kinase KinB